MLKGTIKRSAAMTAAVLLGAGTLLGCGAKGPKAGSGDAPVEAAAANPTVVKTVENLQTAFDGESNANARYLAFAQKADQEGYGPVASLFRAAARAEEIHAKNHAEVLRAIGAEPRADVKAPDVKSTRENLKAALEGENYERQKMYPQFITQAREAGNADAVRTLNLAKNAEIEHAKLYGQALDDLESWKGAARTFYVCEVCGYTTASITGVANCPSCFAPKEKLTTVS